MIVLAEGETLKLMPLTASPEHTAWLFPLPEEVTVTVGFVFTVMVITAEAVQVLAPEATTVYSVVAGGVAITGVPVELLKVAAGDQVNVMAFPIAVRVELFPAQTW